MFANFLALLMMPVLLGLLGVLGGGPPYCIRLVDRETGWPVPMVQLRTVHQVKFYSDNAGNIAFDLPELLGKETWLYVVGDGYSVAKDGFGFEGFRCTPISGQSLVVPLERSLPGKRLGRITGGGLFAESQKLGQYQDWVESGVLGCDSIQMAVLKDRLFWSWGDTSVASYPLGIFHMTGGTTSLRPLESLVPPIKLQWSLFRDRIGKVRSIAEMPGDGPSWLGGYAVLPDGDGVMHFVATYEKISPPMQVREVGFCEWDFHEERFEHKGVFWVRKSDDDKPPLFPTGHAFEWKDSNGGQWLLAGHGTPSLQIPATYDGYLDPNAWKTHAPQTEVADQAGALHEVHRGSVAWNAYLERWVFLFCELKGKASPLGEIWVSVGDSPFGPFNAAVQVATHPNYSFYNPLLHPELTESSSPVLLFEGTYTHSFSPTQEAQPRVDYNQVLYRIDLDEAPFGDWKR